MSIRETCDVAIVGAGPYGLSLAAHLAANQVDFRIFGNPMSVWRTRMPAGMYLKSEGCASNLSDPSGSFTLERFCHGKGLAYGDYALPVSLETFTRYGLEFQRRFVPNVEDTSVTALRQDREGFELRLQGTEVARARRVVLALGLTYFEHLPPILQGLPSDRVSHSSRHTDLSVFGGRDVTVIGGGQSALETAALLSEQGAEVRILVRRDTVAWNHVPGAERRTLHERVRHPMGGLGAGWRTFFYSEMPMAFRLLPRNIRVQAVGSALGPAGAWWLRERVAGGLPILVGHMVSRADVSSGRVRLRIQGPNRIERELLTDHVIAGTGYRVRLEAIPFLDPSLPTRIRRCKQGPALSANFESSVAGLYFVGQAAAETFGPVMRFVYGADFTARRLTRHLLGARGAHRVLFSRVHHRPCRG